MSNELYLLDEFEGAIDARSSRPLTSKKVRLYLAKRNGKLFDVWSDTTLDGTEEIVLFYNQADPANHE